MLSRRIIPCLDVRDGRVVKGIKFSELKDAGDPAERALVYEEEGADEIVLLDVSATPEARKTQADTVQKVRAVLSIPLTVGGGVRCVEDARRLLEAGADKVGINTAAVENPEILTSISTAFGRQCTVIAVDAARVQAGGWEVVVLSGKKRTGLDAVDWCAKAEQLGAGEILLTSFDRDGTRSGYDLELLAAVRSRTHVPIIASGGANSTQDMAQALAAGADAVLAASIFHYDGRDVIGIKRELAELGYQVRL